MSLDSGSKDWTLLKAWSTAIGVIGIPGAIAIYLVYIGATEVPKLVKSSDAAVIEIRATQKILSDQTKQLDRLLRMAQRICSNSAKSDEQRERCFDD